MRNLLYDISNFLENYPVDEINNSTSNLSDDEIEYLKQLLKQIQEQFESLTVTTNKLLEILPVPTSNSSEFYELEDLEELTNDFEEQSKSLKVTINELREKFPELFLLENFEQY